MTYYFTNKIKKEIGKNIKNARKQKGMFQIDVATESGINSSYYSKIERGEVNFSVEKLYKIVRVLEIHSSDILTF